jgi:putative ABC transport system permease protein
MWSLFTIAIRNVLRNKRRTLITLAALIVGVGVMVSVRGLLNGLHDSMIDSVTKGQTGALQVHRKGYLANVLSEPLGLDLPMDAAFLKKIKAVPHITGVAPRIRFAGMVNLRDETLFVAFSAVDPVQEFVVCPRAKDILSKEGKVFVGTASDDAILVTEQLATGFQPKGGGKPDLSGQAAVLAPDKDGALSGENARIVGMLQLKSPGEKKVAMVTLSLAQRLLKMEGRATELAIAVDDLENSPAVMADLRRILGPDYEVHGWDDVATFFKDIVFRQNVTLSLIATVFLILMLLGVANTMLMSVLDRTREIGTMMAVGVRRGRIVLLFLMEAATIGVLGGIAGSAVGSGLVYWLGVRGIQVPLPTSTVPFEVRPYVTLPYVLSIVAVAGVGALVFAVYPAWRASRLRPVEALAGG